MIVLDVPSPGDRGLRSIELWTDHLCVVLPPRHPLATESEIPIEALAGEVLIVGHRHCGCGARADVDRFIGAHGTRSRIEDAANLNALRALVGADRGIGLITGGQAESIFASDVTIRPLKERSFLRRTFALHRADNESTLVACNG
jgi:DNA-binding transcriptional LysR family regulator